MRWILPSVRCFSNMNIFVSSFDAKESAQALDDKRLIKMILETTQIISTNINLAGLRFGPYKTTHRNHPVTVWARRSHDNYLWLCAHLVHLCREYTKRFHKTHKCEQYINLLYNCSTDLAYPQEGLTTFPNCTTFKDIKETTRAYRLYLNQKWTNDKRKPKWTNSKAPEWAA
jgi:hypothetical protein